MLNSMRMLGPILDFTVNWIILLLLIFFIENETNIAENNVVTPVKWGLEANLKLPDWLVLKGRAGYRRSEVRDLSRPGRTLLGVDRAKLSPHALGLWVGREITTYVVQETRSLLFANYLRALTAILQITNHRASTL